MKIEQKFLTNPILTVVSTHNLSIDQFVHILGLKTYFDTTVAVSFVHCELQMFWEVGLIECISVMLTITRTIVTTIIIIMTVMDIVLVVRIISFMWGICNYIPEVNHVCRVYSVAAIL
jgi:hypothetical protein